MRTRSIIAFTAVAVLGFTACGGDDDDATTESEPATDQTEPSTDTAAPADTAEPNDTAVPDDIAAPATTAECPFIGTAAISEAVGEEWNVQYTDLGQDISTCYFGPGVDLFWSVSQLPLDSGGQERLDLDEIEEVHTYADLPGVGDRAYHDETNGVVVIGSDVYTVLADPTNPDPDLIVAILTALAS